MKSLESAASPSDPSSVLLAAEGISKRFGITQALDDVSVTFLAGEIHALMGENGAGKSTLGKVIGGLHRQDTGTVRIAAGPGQMRELTPGSIDDAFHAGVRIVHQELAQCPNLTVAENLSLHDLPRTRMGLLDRRAMTERAAALVHRLEPGIDVEAPLGLLSPGRRQICQIAAALDDRSASGGSSPRVIVFDEPTSSLSIAETERLLEITRKLAAGGITIIYVSHRMGEIFAVCDRVTVLRDGKFVATSRVRDLDEPTLVEQMIGRRLSTPTGKLPSLAAEGGHVAHPGKPLLKVSGLSSASKLSDISLEVREREIVGIGGLVGSGRSELLNAIFGLDVHARGRVDADGKVISGGGPRAAIEAGIGYVPEDRRLQGLFFLLGVGENTVVPYMKRLARALGIRNQAGESRLIRDRFAEFRVKAASPASLPGELSGGNQQKLLIARWMGEGTKVLLLDEPTRGIDVGTKAEIYKLVRAAADAGAAVLLVSSEMPELLALSDRILVMANGKVTGELRDGEMTQANILKLATAEREMPAGQEAKDAGRVLPAR
ncbi:MAG: sugar ABC transporter ATP-binding protein [Phycisphaerales bacterium]|nr:sugar ABC transporter ATP-binding protein [Planctomycetota bacterium]